MSDMVLTYQQLRTLFDVVDENLAQSDKCFVELDTFGTDDVGDIVRLINTFAREHLGCAIDGCHFYNSSVGVACGVRLADGRSIVIKARPPADVNPDLSLDREALQQMCDVLQWLSRLGYPCAEPIVGPTPLGPGLAGLATAEGLLSDGHRGDGFNSSVRRAIAAGLAELVDLLRSYSGRVDRLRRFGQVLNTSGRLYPVPHSKLFDFETTSEGAEWIDDLVRCVRTEATIHRQKLPDSPVLGHADWRVEHLRFDYEPRIVATYDWDSLAVRPEPELVGISAHGFTADWTLNNVRRIPGPEDILAYVAEYERARGRTFSVSERRVVFAPCVYWIAYGARCEHARDSDTREYADDTWAHLFRHHAEALVRT